MREEVGLTREILSIQNDREKYLLQPLSLIILEIY
jgi:hypothetical protein